MIFWTRDFPRKEQPFALWRYAQAHCRFFDLPKSDLRFGRRPRLGWSMGYQRRLARLRDLHRGSHCVVAAAGPSLVEVDLKALVRTPTITCNGAYRVFERQGVVPDFFCMEDIDQVEKRRSEWPDIKAGTKLAALHNSYALKPDRNTIYFHTPRHSEGGYYWSDEPRLFSRDFASIVYLGGSIVYVMLQLAYHLGCDPVYVVGLDHTYRPLIDRLGIGEVTHKNRFVSVTKANIELIGSLHPVSGYFSVGDTLALPFVDEQETYFRVARESFEKKGRKIINATKATRLDVLEKGALP